MAESGSVQIAAAVPADVPVILELIRDLAEFERLLDEAVATEAQLQEHLFGPHPKAQVLIARVDDQVAGFALFFHNFSTFLGKPGIYLEDLFVRPAFRGRSVGATLLRRLATLAVEQGCGRLEWSVLDWNQRAIDFYRALGAQPLNEWTIFRVTGDALTRLGGADDV